MSATPTYSGSMPVQGCSDTAPTSFVLYQPKCLLLEKAAVIADMIFRRCLTPKRTTLKHISCSSFSRNFNHVIGSSH